MERLRKILHAVVCVLLVSILLGGFCLPVAAKTADEKESAGYRTREINIVYDDSGSMFFETTSWSQAKYALEVFTAMMGKHDTVNIYELSKQGKKPVRLLGKDDRQKNVDIVDAIEGTPGSTPFGPVQIAGDDLMRSTADDKWLVIITDGVFDYMNDAETRNSILKYVGEDTKVVYIAIGGQGASVVDLTNEARDGFYPFRTDERSILDTMTKAATLVFNYKPVPLAGVGSGTISFHADIPLAKVVVFAQGQNVTVENMQTGGKDLQSPAEERVRVKTDLASGGAKYGPLAAGLNGIVYTALPQDPDVPFAGGDYTFRCSAENVQVFVEPGVSVETVLVGDSGETVSIEDNGMKEIPEGNWKVEVHLIDPLTGKVIHPSGDSLISGYALGVVVTDDQGKTRTYGSGDTLTITGKKVEIYGKAVFPGMTENIEKTSKVHSLKVIKSKLYLSFDAPGGYELDAVMLQTDKPIRFAVTINGKALIASQTEKVKFTVKAANGIAWEVRKVDDSGHFEILPSYEKRSGLKAVIAGDLELTVAAKLNDGGDRREGEGSVKVRISTESQAGLALTLTLPPETIPADRGSSMYMFDCRMLGLPTGEPGDTERPYILVTVTATNEQGVSRKLTDEEWEQGLDGFSFKAKERYPNFLWRLAERFVVYQGLDFKAVKGPEPSTYMLYLDYITSLNVLPNTSDLEVTLTYRFENGAALTGGAEAAVSVKPLPLWRYLIWLIVILAVVAVLAFVIIREFTKPRFPRNFRPWVSTFHTKAGAAVPIPHDSEAARYKRKYSFSLTKAEECRIQIVDHPDAPTGITGAFSVVAINRVGDFKYANMMQFQAIPASATFNYNQTLNEMLTNPNTANSTFNIVTASVSLSVTRGINAYNKTINFVEI